MQKGNLLSAPTGWLYDLWAGEGTEQAGVHTHQNSGVKRSVSVSEYIYADYPLSPLQRFIQGLAGGYYNRYYLTELEDGSWLCVYFDDYLALTGTDNYPTGYVRYTTTEERRMLNRMAEDYDVDPFASKRIYDSEKMKAVLGEVIIPQLAEEMIAVFKTFTFEQFIALCENRKNGILRYSRNPGIDDAPLNMARGHNRIWQKDIKGSIPLLEHALLGYEQHFIHCKKLGEQVLHYIQEEYSATQELLSFIKSRDTDKEIFVLDYMEKLERIALNKAWGVMLPSEGKTIRLKKKELL